MSALQILYNDIYDKLGELNSINTIEDYNGQYLDANQIVNNNIKYPAVFIEVLSVRWNKSWNRTTDFDLDILPPQQGTATIRLHVVMHTLARHNTETKNSLFDLANVVTRCVHRLQATNNDNGNYTTLMRVNEMYRTPNKQLKAVLIDFETQLTDAFTTEDFQELTGYTVSIISSIN